MTYYTVALVSQLAAMALFGAVMAGVLIYALWPGNRAHFDRAARLPLKADPEDLSKGEAEDGR